MKELPLQRLNGSNVGSFLHEIQKISRVFLCLGRLVLQFIHSLVKFWFSTVYFFSNRTQVEDRPVWLYFLFGYSCFTYSLKKKKHIQLTISKYYFEQK